MAVAITKRKLLLGIIIVLLLFMTAKFILLEKQVFGTSTKDNWVTMNPMEAEFTELNIIHDDLTQSPKKLILLWTPFFGKTDYIKSLSDQGCPDQSCRFTSDRSKLLESQALIFHLRDLDLKNLPKSRLITQRWILLHHESPPNTPNILSKLNGLFNWTITYRLNSDIILTPLPYKVNKPTERSVNYAANKSKLAVWFVSNCQTNSNREGFVSELQKTIPVDIVGLCGTKTCEPKMSPKCYEEYTKDYYFYFAFENSICKDYVTEKLYFPLGYNVVPVVLGGSDYSQVAPPHSVINALDFDSPRSLGKYLLKVSQDKDKYNSYLDWKSKYEVAVRFYGCRVCEKLNDPKEPAKIWLTLDKWWFKESNCRRWPDIF